MQNNYILALPVQDMDYVSSSYESKVKVGANLLKNRKIFEIFFIILQWFRSIALFLTQNHYAMKKRMLVLLTAFTAMSLSVSSCSAALTEDLMQDGYMSTEKSRLRIRISENYGTRSSISPDESRIIDLCVMAYRVKDGRLAAVQMGKSAEDIDMELVSGEYNIYVTANMGVLNAPVEEAATAAITYTVRSFSLMNTSLPMCWKGKAELKPGEENIINAELSRLVSKIGFRIEPGVLKGLDIKSVRLCQGAGRIRPFMEGGSRISYATEAMDGDYATAADLRKLMSGDIIYFYATENCQGTLLPDNTDPWAKIPDNIGKVAGLCTYVELKAEWNSTADYEGSITYRFFLGEDSVSDFNLRRNSMHLLALYLEEDSMDRISWKIDASQTTPVRWTMSSSLAGNYHDREDFYVTENIGLDFSFDDKGTRYWKNRNNSFHIAGIGDNDKTVIRFSDPVDLGNGRFHATGTCIDSGYYDIVLVNSETGEIEYYMEYGDIHIPGIVAGPPGIHSDTKVPGFEQEEAIFINGPEAEVCLYLVDREGYNINQGDYYGCDLTIPDWHVRILTEEYGHDIGQGTVISQELGETGSDSYAVRYLLRIENDGMDEAWNRQLTESLGAGMLGMTFEDRHSGASGRTSAGLYCDNITITFKPVPEEMKATLQSEFMYAVGNTSNLPINIRGLKLNSLETVPSRSDIMAVNCRTISGYSGNIPLLVTRMPYTLCSLEPDAARSVIIEGVRCYAAYTYDIEQSMIPYQLAMFHSLEADLAYTPDYWRPSFTGHIDMYYTAGHKLTYGQEGYMNCGMAFHSPMASYMLYDSNNGINTDFRDYGSLLDKEAIGMFDNIAEIQIGINENNEITATSSRKTEIRISVSGKLDGHIRCVTIQDPLYTVWGHYFTESISFSHTQTLTLGRDPMVIDSRALADAFEQMRQAQYYSVVDAWNIDEFRTDDHQGGTIREYLKPYGIELSIGISTTDGTPVAVRFSGSATYDYKTSSPVTWATGLNSYVTMVPSSHSGFDDRLDDDGCPPGALFKAETIYLQPDVTLDSVSGLYYMTR